MLLMFLSPSQHWKNLLNALPNIPILTLLYYIPEFWKLQRMGWEQGRVKGIRNLAATKMAT
jgi:hypothetical protein